MANEKFVKVYFSEDQEHRITDLMGFAAGRGLSISGVLEETVDVLPVAEGQPSSQVGLADSPPDAMES